MSDSQLAQVRRRAHEAWLAARNKEQTTAEGQTGTAQQRDDTKESESDDDVVVVGEKRCRGADSADSDLALALALQSEELEWGAAAAAAAAAQEADDHALALALALQDSEFTSTDAGKAARPLQCTPAAPLDVLDPALETADPTPDIHQLFCRFDSELFGAALAAVSVAWSPRMTVCAGICYYRAGGLCEIKLSKPLLQFRPRADLVNTLLVCPCALLPLHLDVLNEFMCFSFLIAARDDSRIPYGSKALHTFSVHPHPFMLTFLSLSKTQCS